MQKLRTLSRSIVNDPIYQKISQTRFKNHKQTLKNPYAFSQHSSLKKSLDDQKSQQYALQISRYKKAKIICNEKVDPVILQNRSLVRKLQEIDKQKSKSMIGFKVSKLSKHKVFAQKIKEENKFIFEKIKQERQNIRSKKDFKKQFAEVDKLIMHSRRIKETIKKCKKEKKKISFQFSKDPKDFIFSEQSQSKAPTPQSSDDRARVSIERKKGRFPFFKVYEIINK